MARAASRAQTTMASDHFFMATAKLAGSLGGGYAVGTAFNHSAAAGFTALTLLGLGIFTLGKTARAPK